MERRQFVALIGGSAMFLPLAARAQAPSSRPLVAYFAGGTQWNASRYKAALQEGLREMGYVEGRDIDLIFRYGDGRADRYPAIAEELVGLKPAVIVAGAVDTAVALRKATRTIPIVSAALADAEHLGLVASYARPGGNVSGITPYISGLPAKQMELAREVVPGAAKVGLLGNMSDPKAVPQRQELEDAGKALGVKFVVPEVRSPEDLPGAIQAMAADQVDVIIVLQTTMLLSERRQISLLIAASRLPAVYGYREHVEEGGLVSYGVDLRWCFRHIATYVDKILKGAAPGDLPVEFPTKVQMVVNLKTAKALGLTLPAAIFARADEVIE